MEVETIGSIFRRICLVQSLLVTTHHSYFTYSTNYFVSKQFAPEDGIAMVVDPPLLSQFERLVSALYFIPSDPEKVVTDFLTSWDLLPAQTGHVNHAHDPGTIPSSLTQEVTS